MEFARWFTSEQSAIATAAAAGSFVALLVTRKNGWLQMVALFVVGQLSAFYWTVPAAQRMGLDSGAYGWLGFLIGATAMLIWGAIMRLFQGLSDDPWGTIARARELWKGKGG